MNPFPMPCGRLDWHGTHTWTRPRLGLGADIPERTYTCHGRVMTERGYWADWDAEDDKLEDRLDRELRDGLSTWGMDGAA